MTLQAQYDALPVGGLLVIPLGIHHETLELDPAKPVTISGPHPVALHRLSRVGRAVLAPPAGSTFAIRCKASWPVYGFHFRDFAIDPQFCRDTIRNLVEIENVSHPHFVRVSGLGQLKLGPLDAPLVRATLNGSDVDSSWLHLEQCWGYGVPLLRAGGAGQAQGHNDIRISGGGVNMLARTPGSNQPPYRGPEGLAGIEVLHQDATTGRMGFRADCRVENARVGVRLVGHHSAQLTLSAENFEDAAIELLNCQDVQIDRLQVGGYLGLALRALGCRDVFYNGRQRVEVRS